MNMDDPAPMREIHGIAFLFTETGTEGGWWAVQEDGYLDTDGVHWRYEGLQFLEEGDDFTVYADDGSVLWTGIIRKDEKTGRRCHRVLREGKGVVDRRWQQQVVGGFWVHWVQHAMDPEAWGSMFVGRKRCLLKPAAPKEVTDGIV